MSDQKISALGQLPGAPAADDEFVVVDKSDTAMAASGTDKRMRFDQISGLWLPYNPPSLGLSLSADFVTTTAALVFMPWTVEDVDTDNQHFTSGANLTGTVSKTSGQNTLTGTGTAFTSELTVGQVIIVPASGGDIRVVTAIASDTSLTVNGNWSATASGQTGRRSNECAVCRVPGTYHMWAAGHFGSDNQTGRRALIVTRVAGAAAGVSVMTDERQPAASGGNTSFAPSKNIRLSQWDILYVTPFQNSGANKSFMAASETYWSPAGFGWDYLHA